jgi:hypothetical protein
MAAVTCLQWTASGVVMPNPPAPIDVRDAIVT